MGGRHITITCNFCGFVNKMERIIAEGETERTIRCHSCEGLLIARLDNLPRDFRPNTEGKRAPR